MEEFSTKRSPLIEPYRNGFMTIPVASLGKK